MVSKNIGSFIAPSLRFDVMALRDEYEHTLLLYESFEMPIVKFISYRKYFLYTYHARDTRNLESKYLS